jgi:hypothetical protein
MKKIFTIILVINALISLAIIFSNLFNLKEPFQNIKALNQSDKYLTNDILVLDTIIKTSKVKDGSTSYSTTIKGKLINENISREISFLYKDNSYEKDIFKFKYKMMYQKGLKVYRNVINDNIFLKNLKYLQNKKRDALLKIYFICSLIPSLILTLVLMKNKK